MAMYVFRGKFGSMHVAVKKVKKKPPNSPSADAEVIKILLLYMMSSKYFLIFSLG